MSVPLYPVEHHYVVSEPIEGAFDELPCGRDPDTTIYFRGEGNIRRAVTGEPIGSLVTAGT